VFFPWLHLLALKRDPLGVSSQYLVELFDRRVSLILSLELDLSLFLRAAEVAERADSDQRLIGADQLLSLSPDICHLQTSLNRSGASSV
jgi:hypothetical protein